MQIGRVPLLRSKSNEGTFAHTFIADVLRCIPKGVLTFKKICFVGRVLSTVSHESWKNA